MIITIGITGHQHLPDESLRRWLRRELINEIGNLKNIIYAHSSLAIGADQLFAKIMISKKIDVIAVIPCNHYEQTFNELDRKEYLKLLSKCKEIKILNFPIPSEQAFLSAGQYVVQNSDLLFAIWDGKSAEGLGGTGDIVKYALEIGKPIVHLNSISRSKNYI